VPSPIGHVLGGAAVVFAADAIDRRRSPFRLVATGAVLGAIADLDLLLPGYHRSITHSVIAVVVVLSIAAAVTGRVTRLREGRDGGQARWRVALICACAYASHLLLDWLGSDTLPPFGLQVFWPFDGRFFVSGLNLFAETERRHPFSGPTLIQNLWAAAQEVAILAPVAFGLWLIRVKALARLPAELSRRDHAPQ
jgi:inner membrane protein